jgi:hypothetical protein
LGYLAKDSPSGNTNECSKSTDYKKFIVRKNNKKKYEPKNNSAAKYKIELLQP